MILESMSSSSGLRVSVRSEPNEGQDRRKWGRQGELQAK